MGEYLRALYILFKLFLDVLGAVFLVSNSVAQFKKVFLYDSSVSDACY
jgi:hypothetical protein